MLLCCHKGSLAGRGPALKPACPLDRKTNVGGCLIVVLCSSTCTRWFWLKGTINSTSAEDCVLLLLGVIGGIVKLWENLFRKEGKKEQLLHRSNCGQRKEE